MDTCTQLCNVIRNQINEYDHNSGIDLGAHISTVEPISYDLNGCCLMTVRPSPYLNSNLPTKIQLRLITVWNYTSFGELFPVSRFL